MTRKEKRIKKQLAIKEYKNKIYNNFDYMLDFEQYVLTFFKCRKGTSWKKSIQKFQLNLFTEILDIIEKVKQNKKITLPPIEFTINERGKERKIRSIPIQERIVVKNLCNNIIAPLILPSLIYNNYACIKNKGTYFAKEQLKKQLMNYYIKNGNKGHVLTLDFSKYFANINHDIVLEKMSRVLTDKRAFNLMKQVIDSSGEVGLCLGSELSQLIATWYPSELDHYIKEVLKIKYYGRYMDDLYLIHRNKEYLQYCLKEIKKICEKLKIIINEKKTTFHRTEIGFIFLKCNFKITETGKIIVKPSKKNILRLRRKLKKQKKLLDANKITYNDIRKSYESWKGHLKGSNCYKVMRNMEKYYIKIFELERYIDMAREYAKIKKKRRK